MLAVSDLRTGGRQSNATYQYTLLSDDAKRSTNGRRGSSTALCEDPTS